MGSNDLTTLAKRLRPLLINVAAGVVTQTLTAGEGPGIDVINSVIGMGLDSILLAHADGSPATEYATITAACAAASSGDVVVIARAGTFAESFTVPAGVCVWGLERNHCIISGQVTLGGDGAALAHVGVIYSAESEDAVGAVYGPESGSGRILECHISGTNTGAGGGYGIIERAGAVVMKGGWLEGSTLPAGKIEIGLSEVSTGAIDPTNSSGASITGLTIGVAYAVEVTGNWLLAASDPLSIVYTYHIEGLGPYGFGAYGNGTPYIYRDAGLPSWAYASETVDGLRHRIYFVATKTSYTIKASEWNNWADNGNNDFSWKISTASEIGIVDATVQLMGVQLSPVVGVPLGGDRAAWDADNYASLHANDTDTETGIHHTLGTGANQAAAGNHTHAATNSVTVREQDGLPSLTATTIEFATGTTVSDQGSGVVRVTPPSGSGAAVGIGPAGIDHCMIWLYAANISGLSDGDTIITWPDASGYGNDAYAYGSPIYKTSILNSLPVARLDGSSYFKMFGFPLLKPTFAWAIVFKMSSIANAYTGVVNYCVTSDAGGYFIKSNGKSAEYWSSNYDGTGAITYNTTDWNYVLSNHKTTTFDVRRNGSADATGIGSAMRAFFETGAIGTDTHASGRGMTGDIAEFVMFSRMLSTSEITTLESYLATKYGL